MDSGNIRTYDQDSTEIELFRQRVLTEDLLVSSLDCDHLLYKSEFEALFRNHSEREEIYKFSKMKWNRVKFTTIFGLVENGELVSISGCRWYDDKFMRLGMYYYTLKKFRKRHRSILWRQNGFFDATTRLFADANGYFVTIYPHNKKLMAWTQRLKGGGRFAQMGNNEIGVVEGLNRFIVAPDLVEFNGVPQLVMYCAKTRCNIPSNFFEEIGRDS